jgi:hypothetical protein
MELKKSQTISCVVMHFPHEHDKAGVSLLNLQAICISIKKNHELYDGEAQYGA